MVFKPSHHFVDCLDLVLPWRESFFPRKINLNLGTREGHIPVHWCRSDISHTDAAGLNHLVFECFFGILGPFVRSGDDLAMREVLFALLRLERMPTGLKERVNVALLNTGGFFIELRLDSYPAIVINAVCHQVDAGICFASVIAPVAPAIDLIKLAGKRRSSTVEIHHQFLNSNTVLALRLMFAELFQHVTKCSHRVIIYETTPMCSIRGGVTRHFRIL